MRPVPFRLGCLLTEKHQGLRQLLAGKPLGSGLMRTGRRKPVNVVELLPQVKDLFL